MTKRRSTKRALLSSVVALLLCFSMLLGSTFAWFTDSTTSGRNTIQSGNLDVVLEYKTDWDDDWKEVTSETKLFKEDALYEPGYTEVVYLRVANEGSLALKYDLKVKAANERTSKNVYDETFKLSDYLEIGAYVQDEYSSGFNYADILMPTMFGTREFAISNIKNFTKVSDFDSIVRSDAPVLPGEQTAQVAALVLRMPEEVGNEANHKTGVEVPKLELGIELVATQHTHEKDSFGNDYDEGVDPTASYLFSGLDIHKSTNKSGKYILSSDIQTSTNGDDARYGHGYEYIVRDHADYTLDLNGKTLTHDTVNENANKDAFTYTFVANQAGTKLTIDGDGKIHSNNSEGYTCAVQGKDGTLITINGGDYQVDNGIAVWAGAGAHIVINGGSFVNGKSTTDHELIYSSGGVIDIYGGFFHNTNDNYTLNVEDRNHATGFINVYGGTYVNFNPSTGGQDPNNIKVANGYKVVSETQENGDIWYTVVAE